MTMKTFEQFSEQSLPDGGFHEPGDQGFLEVDMFSNKLTIGLDFKHKYRITIDSKEDISPENLERGREIRGMVSRRFEGPEEKLGPGYLYYIRSSKELVIRAPGEGNFAVLKRVSSGLLENMYQSVLFNDGYNERMDMVEFSVGGQ